MGDLNKCFLILFLFPPFPFLILYLFFPFFYLIDHVYFFKGRSRLNYRDKNLIYIPLLDDRFGRVANL